MISKRTVGAALALVVFASSAPVAWSADPPDLFLNHLDDFIWSGAGDGTTWQSPANWTAPPARPGVFPDDPGRIDDPAVAANVTTINSLVGANLSVPRTTDLTVNINGSNVTVASLKLGGTTNAVTTDIVSTTSHQLVFENAELNDNSVATAVLYSFNQNKSLIWSTGTAGVGKVNRISANMLINDDVDVEGDRDLHIYGNVVEGVLDRNTGDAFAETLASRLSSLLSNGATMYIHGNINTVGLSPTGTVTASDGPGGDREFWINASSGQLLGPDPGNSPVSPPRQGNVDISGQITGNGLIRLGSRDNSSLVPLSTIFLRGNSSSFTGRVVTERANLVLDNDNALGAGDFKSGQSTVLGQNYISTSDSRKIATVNIVSGVQTVRGATSVAGLESIGDHSIEFSGRTAQTNTGSWLNLLPAGKTLTISGPVYPNIKSEGPPGLGRIFTFDGPGKTIISGGIHDQYVTGTEDPGLSDKIGSFSIQGSGTVVIDYNEANVTDTPTDYNGFTFVEGGNLHFHDNNDLPSATSTTSSGGVISRSGAIGVDTGVVGNSTFLGMLNNSSNPNWTPPTTSPYFLSYTAATTVYIFNRYSEGGLMLGNGEYTQNLDFNSSPLSNAANMTLAAQEGGSTYTGTITPSSSVAVNPNTYQLGGGSGTLTLPNANQLTGARNLLVANGGQVALTNTNNYTGTTTIRGKYAASNEGVGPNNSSTGSGEINGDTYVNSTFYRHSTLTVTSLVNGGLDSGIGKSSNAASNLVVQGSTLKYTGAATSTDRLFTVGTAGATIDASGSGAVNFANTGALAIQSAGNRGAVITTAIAGSNTILGIPSVPSATFNSDDLVVGMRVFDDFTDFTDDDSPVVITSIQGPNAIKVAETDLVTSENDNDPNTHPDRWPGYALSTVRTIKFGPAPARMLTLSGTNTGNNTLASVVGSEVNANATPAETTAGFGSVGIRKQGTGKWILTGNNTYTGATNVEAGTLLVNGTQTGGGAYTVLAGATLGGTGSITGAVTNNGMISPGASVGMLTVTGDVTLAASSILAVELLGATADKLAITGNLDLSALGNVLNVTDLGKTGTSWVIASYTGALTGIFETITSGYTVNYGAGTNSQITLNFVGGSVAGDYNGDGHVDASDYTIWQDTKGSTTDLRANGDNTGASAGVIDNADFLFWKSHFGMPPGAGGGGLGNGTVPEPASWLMAAMALLGLIGRTRRLRRG